MNQQNNIGLQQTQSSHVAQNMKTRGGDLPGPVDLNRMDSKERGERYKDIVRALGQKDCELYKETALAARQGSAKALEAKRAIADRLIAKNRAVAKQFFEHVSRELPLAPAPIEEK